MKGKIKILFFHFDLGEGGAERVLVNLLNNLDTSLYDITLRTIFSGTINRKNLKEHVNFKPLFNRKAFRGIRLLFKLMPAKLLNKILIKDKYDIQIAFLEGIPTRIVGATKPLDNEKKFAWIHISADNPNSFTTSFRNMNEFNRIYMNFNKLAFVSKKALEDFEKFYKVPVPKYVVHNVNEFGNILKLSQERTDITLSRNKINLCSIGRLTNQKRFDRLIKALYHLDKDGISHWHLFILGKGELENELKTLSNDLGLSDKITFLGFQDNPYKYLSKMDLFVCPSEKEGFSTAITEAIFLGVPVLTTNCGGVEEIIEHNLSGYIVENSLEGIIKGLNYYFSLNQTELKHLKEMAVITGKSLDKQLALNEFAKFIEL